MNYVRAMPIVTPANAGVHWQPRKWIPAFAGMTKFCGRQLIGHSAKEK